MDWIEPWPAAGVEGLDLWFRLGIESAIRFFVTGLIIVLLAAVPFVIVASVGLAGFAVDCGADSPVATWRWSSSGAASFTAR